MKHYTGKSGNHPAVYWKRYSARVTGWLAVALFIGAAVILAVR